MLSVGLQGPLKEIELKACAQDKNYQTLIITPPVLLQCPLPHLEQPVLLLPTPTKKGMWLTPHHTPNQPASVS